MSLIRRILDRANDFRKTYLSGNTRDAGNEVPIATFARALVHPRTNEVALRINDYGQFVEPKAVASTAYVATNADTCLLFAIDAPSTCDLPNPSLIPGKLIEVKNTVDSTSTVTVRVAGDAGTIDGDEVTLAAGDCLVVRAGGESRYEIISLYIPA